MMPAEEFTPLRSTPSITPSSPTTLTPDHGPQTKTKIQPHPESTVPQPMVPLRLGLQVLLVNIAILVVCAAYMFTHA